MQEKMASRNRFLRALGSATSRLWFPATLAFARNLPRAAMHRGARAAAAAYYALRPKYLRAARANLSVILQLSPEDPAVRRAAGAMVASHFAAWVDFLHFATRPPEQTTRLIEGVVGYSRIVEGLLKGRGVLLLTAHLGNWEVGGLMLAQMRQSVHVVLVPDIFPGVEAARRRLHGRTGVSEIRIDRTFLPSLSVLRVLRGNGLVAMQGDRDFNNTGLTVPFFGREAFFPRGPLRVAMASGATVLPAFIVRQPDGRYRAIVEEPLAVETIGDPDEAVRTNLLRYVAILERYVRATPEQWYCFYPFWDDPSRRPDSSEGRRAETAATKNAS